MPVSMFQTDQFRIKLQALPDQTLAFYSRIEAELTSIFNAIANKSQPLETLKNRLTTLRYALTNQLLNGNGQPLY